MKNTIELNEFAKKIHKQNRSMGWWSKPRSKFTFLELFHSELSEAMEGHRKKLMDDHLPHYPMVQVELADFVIRVLDYLHNHYGSIVLDVEIKCNHCDFHEFLTNVREQIMKSHKGNANYLKREWLLTAVKTVFEYANIEGFDLLAIAEEKLTYNITRADHQIKNRNKPGGKEY